MNDLSRASKEPSCALRDVAAAPTPFKSLEGVRGVLASAIAVHEAGHTIVARFCGLPLGGATVVSTDDYGGLTFAPGADRLNVTRAALREEARRLPGGVIKAKGKADWRMAPNPKWLEILKDAEIPLPVAAACGLFLLAARRGWFPPPADWMMQLAWIGLLLFGFLFGVQLLKLFFYALWILAVKLRAKGKRRP